MSEAPQLATVDSALGSDDLKLLVEWSNPWEEFRSSIRPALSRSPLPLAGEARTGLLPYRGMLVTWAGEAILLALAIILPAKIASMRPYTPPHLPKYDVIYFSADELPQTQDVGGAQSGRSGRGGGQEAHHRTQTIRVARGNTVTEKVVDAPDLKLPVSSDPVKNLLALRHIPGPPPAEGLKSSAALTPLSKNAIVAPPPQVLQEMSRKTPNLASQLIAPPPDPSAARKTLAELSASVVAPPPSDVSTSKHTVQGVMAQVVAPPPSEVTDEHSHAVLAMSAPIVQPAPSDPQRELPPLRAPVSGSTNVVPPPVSTPQRASSQVPKLALPAPAVVAPPPSQVSRDARTLSGVELSDPQKVVPPPVQAGNTPTPKQAINAVLGTANVVPPPPSVSGGTSLSGGGAKRNGSGAVLTATNVIAPPPSISGGASSGSAGGPGHRGPEIGLGSGSVVPPPPTMASGGSASGTGRTAGGIPGGTPGGASVVAPPPSLPGLNATAGGRGTGNKGAGLGGPLDSGSVLAPPNAGGADGDNKGVVVSNKPGSAEGAPRNGGPGTIAMSPAGGDKSGIGGSGGGGGLVHGNGPGSGLTGEGPGGGKNGSGKGSDPKATGGISPYPGPGGSGSGRTGQTTASGVSVQGGSTVNLPSFGSTGTEPIIPGRSATGKTNDGFGVTIEASSGAGGGFGRYRQLPGTNYTIPFIPTAVGPMVMQYADPSSASHPYMGRITDPVPMNLELPAGLSHSRMVFLCKLDRSGVLRNIRVLEPSRPSAVTSLVIAALPKWKFVPAMLGDQPIEVEALLGFNMDTR